MKALVSKMLGKYIKFRDPNREFTISKGLPQPVKPRLYKDQLRVIETLDKLPVGHSFPIRNELEYVVRKMYNQYHPEYKLVIRNMGTSKRVFRLA